MRRFFLDGPLQPEMLISGDDAHHIGRVLRMKGGDSILVVDTERNSAIAEIAEIRPEFVRILLRETMLEDREPPIRISLAQALPKSDKMDYIVQKAVELGVTTIIPLAAERCVVKYEGTKQEQRCQRWAKIAEEAAKQCGRTAVPEVRPIQGLGEVLGSVSSDVLVCMLYEGQARQGIKELLRNCRAESYLILIGPEGGFSSNEVKMCQQAGVHTVTMGSRILRTETAALAALSIIMYENGDLGGEFF